VTLSRPSVHARASPGWGAAPRRRGGRLAPWWRRTVAARPLDPRAETAYPWPAGRSVLPLVRASFSCRSSGR